MAFIAWLFFRLYSLKTGQKIEAKFNDYGMGHGKITIIHSHGSKM